MPADLPSRGSPEWWLRTLDQRLEERRPRLQRYEGYYSGAGHRLAFATGKFREAFGDLFEAFADNWCRIVVDAAVERLRVEGFRFGPEDQEADKDAWAIWQENGLDADSDLAHTEAVKCEEAYLLVGPGENDTPRISVEHPEQVIVAASADDRRRRAAALKKWLADDGYVMATLYLPDKVHRFRSEKPQGDGQQVRWIYRDQTGSRFPFGPWSQRFGRVPGTVPNPLGVVPVVPLANGPSLLGGGRSDLADVIPLQDAINKLATDMLVASEFAAFRQRVLTGVEWPTDPDTGQPIPGSELKAAMSRVWAFGDSDVRVHEFSATDLSNYVSGLEMLIQHLAAQTRTPPHYLLGQSGAFPSGESLKATETGLMAKVRRKQRTFGEGHEEAMRLAFRLKGDERRGRAFDAETLWADPESKSLGELVDALLKLKDLAIPFEALWARLPDTSPQEIDRWSEDLKRRGVSRKQPLQPQDNAPAATAEANERSSRDG